MNYPIEENTLDQAENFATQVWEPETPFLSDPLPRENENSAISPATAFGPSYEIESPFTSEYTLEGENISNPQAEQFAQLIGELYDPEFEEALTDLVNEASALAEEHQMYESEDPVRQHANVEQALREYLQPIEREATEMYDRMIDAVGERDLSSMSEAEIEALFERFEPTVSLPSPVMEDFLKGFLKKAKRALKSARKLAGKLNPANLVLGKLKKLVRPLLERVLKFAMGKIPAKFRPIAKQLAKRFLGVSAEAEAMDETDSEFEEFAAADPAEIQEEMDMQFAGSLLRGEDFDRQVNEVQFAEAQAENESDTLHELERARRRFAKAIVNLPEGQDPTPDVEQFIPAILAAARIAIKVIGRPRVVNFLAGLIAKLISKYVGKSSAVALSRALVDTGLKLMSLEAEPEAEQLAAGNTIASTVEDTVNKLISDAPAEAWENEELLEAYALEAFEKSAAANFPDSTLKPRIRETSGKSGAWVLKKRYKKYTRVLDVKLTPQMIHWIKSFGHTRLSSVLGHRYGLAINAPISARVHLYEAVRGTSLPQIALGEKGLLGLGQATRSSWTLIHPLTPCTAGLLFQEPGLGRDVSDRYLHSRNVIMVGQRFFFIEIPNAIPLPLPQIPNRKGTGTTRGGRQSQTRIQLHFPKGQIRLFIFYSDADAQKLKQQLRSKSPNAIVGMLTSDLNTKLQSVMGGNSPKRLQIIHEAMPTQQSSSTISANVLRGHGGKIAEWITGKTTEALLDNIKKQSDRFVESFRKATDDPADGLTIRLVFQGPPFFETLRKRFSGGSGNLDMSKSSSQAASVSIDILPGFQYGEEAR